MSFKIKSTVSVYEYPAEGSKAEGINHVVLSRERLLRPGEKIPVSGDVSYDIEGKGDWVRAKGEIRVIDGKTLGIRWRPSFGEALFYAATNPEVSGVRYRISEAREYAEWDEEQEIRIEASKETVLKFEDGYHSEPKLPEVFSLAERALIKPLTEKMLRRIEGIKDVERETKLIYEP